MKRLYLIILLCIASLYLQAQIITEMPIDADIVYTDFVIRGNQLWALTPAGKVKVFDVSTGALLPVKINTGSKILQLAKDRTGNIILGDNSNTIYEIDSLSGEQTELYSFYNKLKGIIFNSHGNCFLLTNKGIYDCERQRNYFPEKLGNVQIRRGKEWFKEPVYIADKNDNIWVGFGYGEWGGELFVFNTNTGKFVDSLQNRLSIIQYPVNAIFEGEDRVFVNLGLMHFYITGSVVAVKDLIARVLFLSETRQAYRDTTFQAPMIPGEYIGAGAYNPADKNIYFHSQNGIFKGNPDSDLSKIESWTNVLKPSLQWGSGQPDAVGASINVTKMAFTNSGKLVFLAPLDGIGIFDGKDLIMIK